MSSHVNSVCESAEDSDVEVLSVTAPSARGRKVFTGRSRNWMFTYFDQETFTVLRDQIGTLYREGKIVVGVFQEETAPTTGKRHLQGYLEFRDAKTLFAVKGLLKVKAIHLEPRNGSRVQALIYVSKEETRSTGSSVIMFGIESSQLPSPEERSRIQSAVVPSTERGRRTDMEQIRDRLRDGATLDELWIDYPGQMVRYGRGIREMAMAFNVGRKQKTHVIVVYGKPGTGKSEYAFEFDRNAYWMMQPTGTQYFDGYDPLVHKTVILDDYYGWLPFTLLLQLMDRYPMIVNTKGGSARWSPETLIITSNKSPEQWYHNEKLDLGALYRRLDEVYLLDEPEIMEDKTQYFYNLFLRGRGVHQSSTAAFDRNVRRKVG